MAITQLRRLANFSQNNMFSDPCKSIKYPVHSFSPGSHETPGTGGTRSEPPGASGDPPSFGRNVSTKPGHAEREPGSGKKSSATEALSLDKSVTSNSNLNSRMVPAGPTCVVTPAKVPHDQPHHVDKSGSSNSNLTSGTGGSDPRTIT